MQSRPLVAMPSTAVQRELVELQPAAKTRIIHIGHAKALCKLRSTAHMLE